jgi:alpha-N-acetylglucosamine transferase
MFIPNKTYHAIRMVTVAIIAVLVMVIAGQSVLYVQLEQEKQLQVDSLSSVVDVNKSSAIQSFRETDFRQNGVEEQLNELKLAVDALQVSVTELQTSLGATRVSVDKLLKNECTPETAIYVLTKDMAAVCRTLGVIP